MKGTVKFPFGTLKIKRARLERGKLWLDVKGVAGGDAFADSSFWLVPEGPIQVEIYGQDGRLVHTGRVAVVFNAAAIFEDNPVTIEFAVLGGE
jgi:hypothetical protein